MFRSEPLSPPFVSPCQLVSTSHKNCKKPPSSFNSVFVVSLTQIVAQSRWVIDFTLFGIMLHQAILWSANWKTERLFSKIIVVRAVTYIPSTPSVSDDPPLSLLSRHTDKKLWAVVISTATTAFGLYYFWSTFVLRFGNFAQFGEINSTSSLRTYSLLKGK